MKFTLKFDIQENPDNGQVDVVMQVMHGATISETYEFLDTTSNMVASQTRRTIETLFEEMASVRRDAREAASHATSTRSKDQGELRLP